MTFDHSLQDGDRCDAKGWDCIEENFNSNFSCSVSCQGIYADVQILTERFTQNTDGRVLHHRENLEAMIGVEEEREDKEKVSRLINEYNEFKRKNLPNFRFNPEKGGTQYGE